MSDKIASHCYTHLETNREKEIQSKRRTYTRRITDSIPDTERNRDKIKWKNADQNTYLFTYNQWQYSWTLIEVFRENTITVYAQREREKQTSSRDAYAHTMNRNISGHWNGHSEPNRERQKYQSKDVRIHAELIMRYFLQRYDTLTELNSLVHIPTNYR